MSTLGRGADAQAKTAREATLEQHKAANIRVSVRIRTGEQFDPPMYDAVMLLANAILDARGMSEPEMRAQLTERQWSNVSLDDYQAALELVLRAKRMSAATKIGSGK